MPPPELSDDLVGEFLLRLPPDDPACLLRASLACKRWRRILADPAFRRRHRELHPAPSVVGFLRIVKGDPPYASRFVPNSPASNLPPARDLPGWLPYDCRHGRALFLTTSPGPGTELTYDLVVWDPLTNEQHCLPRLSPSPPPKFEDRLFNAAVLCAAAAEGCDHHHCHGGPFLVAFVWSRSTGLYRPRVTSACVYSSETGVWSEPTSVQHLGMHLDMSPCPAALVGDTLYFRCNWTHAFEFQLGARRLSIVDGPPPSLCQSFVISFMSMGDGELRSMDVEDEPSLCLRLWSRETAPYSDGVARWTRGRAIELETLLPDGALPISRVPLAPARRIPSVILLGFAEGTDVIFVGTQTRGHRGAVYMVQLNAGRARKVFDKCTLVIPYTSFCIPVTDVASTSEGAREGVSSA
ncbi:unnamed protein product [Urochloa decumbens]|uniref:F-box domain-containing protein n=1 Tax=Urochloa decumbens TaxID=240449 RepID=A0ABC8VSC4_9POAL